DYYCQSYDNSLSAGLF
nr:immunoglobulin light chain junction region [Macaca mulatta]MOY05784.1 immunoglobulin light chain junction region [Macaca mulatta]MOY06182.1 immunoglobulin light chain junction region [Macaca mulatta]MOY06589.1 immunoglobulin light chain junction region [Macaca mulatta]MOY06623.1 immunoglobulin light chain junction region [Macaca mulatta]